MDSNKNLSSANFSAIYPMFLKHEDYSATHYISDSKKSETAGFLSHFPFLLNFYMLSGSLLLQLNQKHSAQLPPDSEFWTLPIGHSSIQHEAQVNPVQKQYSCPP